MTDLQHGLRVDRAIWTKFEPDWWQEMTVPERQDWLDRKFACHRAQLHQWESLVRKSWRWRIAQALRRLVTWIEPR